MNNCKKVLVTGGAGFIGSNFVLQWLERGGIRWPIAPADAILAEKDRNGSLLRTTEAFA